MFPVATGSDGVVALWADAPGRLELEATHPALGTGRVVLDLEPAPVRSPAPVDAYTRAESDALFLTQSEADGLFLTPAEADAAYLPLSYVPPASGISQADADLRYVNTAGDTMGWLGVDGYLLTGRPDGGLTAGNVPRRDPLPALGRGAISLGPARRGQVSNTGNHHRPRSLQLPTCGSDATAPAP